MSNGPPFPQLVSQIEMGTYSLNYRNEPVPYRLAEVDNVPPKQRDPALAFTSIPRINPNVNLNILSPENPEKNWRLNVSKRQFLGLNIHPQNW